MSFSGRRALVTGGSSGIGEGVCRALAEEGAQVIVASTGLERATKVARSLPGKLELYYDIRDRNTVIGLMDMKQVSAHLHQKTSANYGCMSEMKMTPII